MGVLVLSQYVRRHTHCGSSRHLLSRYNYLLKDKVMQRMKTVGAIGQWQPARTLIDPELVTTLLEA